MTFYVADDLTNIDILKCLQKFKKSANKSMRFDYTGAKNSSAIHNLIATICANEGFKRQTVGNSYIKIFKSNSSTLSNVGNPSSNEIYSVVSVVDTPDERNARCEALTAFMSEIEKSAEWFSTTRAITMDNVRALYLDLMKRVQGIH